MALGTPTPTPGPRSSPADFSETRALLSPTNLFFLQAHKDLGGKTLRCHVQDYRPMTTDPGTMSQHSVDETTTARLGGLWDPTSQSAPLMCIPPAPGSQKWGHHGVPIVLPGGGGREPEGM